MFAPLSKIYYYKKNNNTTSQPLDGTIQLDTDLILPSNKYIFVQPEKILMSRLLPNIFNYNNFNNTQIRIFMDGVVYNTLTFPEGQYSITQIQAAVYSYTVSAGWIPTSVTSPPIKFDVNTATQKVTIELNNANAGNPAVTNISLILDYTRFNEMIGFSSAASTITGNGVYYSDIAVNLDVQSTQIYIGTSLVDKTNFNGTDTNFIAQMSINQATNSDIIIYPDNGFTVEPVISKARSYISSINFNVRSATRNSSVDPVLFLPGSDLSIIINILYFTG